VISSDGAWRHAAACAARRCCRRRWCPAVREW